MEILQGLIVLAYIAAISAFLYSVYAVKTYKSKIEDNIRYLRRTAKTEEEREALKTLENIYNETLNAAFPLLVAAFFILLSFIIAPFNFEKAAILFAVTLFIISPICLIAMAVISEDNIKIRHKYGIYDTSEDLKDHALAAAALLSVASNAKKLAGSGKRQTDYFKNKKI